jgi:diadenylate cyclase
MENWIHIRWQNIVDFLLLSIVIYWMLHWGKQTRALRFFLGIGAMLLSGSLAYRLDLLVTSWILQIAGLSSMVLLVVVYYAEIRHALSHLDLINRWIRPSSSAATSDLSNIAEAVFSMATARLGALIVLTGEDSLNDVINGGIPLNGLISREILESIFQKKSPVHDGAVIIENGRISRVGSFLPLTNREDLPAQWGTRHRAAMGVAEHSDAWVVVASEERGEVTLVKGGEYETIAKPSLLALRLEPYWKMPIKGIRPAKYRGIFHNWGLKSASLGIAAMVWAMIFTTGTSIRTYSTPVEFQKVPAGFEVSNTSAGRISIQLRATPWLFNAMTWDRLVIKINLQGMREGLQTVEINSKNLDLPPGVVFEQAFPEMLKFKLIRSQEGNSPSHRLPQ